MIPDPGTIHGRWAVDEHRIPGRARFAGRAGPRGPGPGVGTVHLMQIGVVLPQTELGGDVGAVRAYGVGVEAMGFAHLLAYDHVVGADPLVHESWSGPYDASTTFHEPLVLFGYLAGVTNLELVTGIIILPQRQTVLAAKQAAEVDLLTEGRFRFGVGIGWNAVEYEALGQRFDQRGRRLSEQIVLLRRLWTEVSLSFTGAFDTVTGAGINPLPVQRPIPVWIGGQTEAAYRRIGRLADGWFPQVAPGDALQQALEMIAGSAREAGRDPSTIGMEGRVGVDLDDPDRFVRQVEKWRAAGASHVSIDTMRAGHATVDEHLRALGTAAALLDL
jgi:probable F420-dependent oxidoreductase